MAQSPKGIDVRETAGALLFRAFLQDSDGDLVTSGTSTLALMELQDDGTIKSYDFDDHTFKTGALTTDTVNMTHRPRNNGGTATGLWTYALSTLTGFTLEGIYFAIVNNSGAFPVDQMREFQFGGAEGDLLVTSTKYMQVDVQEWDNDDLPNVALATAPKNTIMTDKQFPMVDIFNVPVTGATVTVQRSIDGGAYADCDNTPADEVSGGDYKIDLTADDRNGDRIMYRATATGCQPTQWEIWSDG